MEPCVVVGWQCNGLPDAIHCVQRVWTRCLRPIVTRADYAASTVMEGRVLLALLLCFLVLVGYQSIFLPPPPTGTNSPDTTSAVPPAATDMSPTEPPPPIPLTAAPVEPTTISESPSSVGADPILFEDILPLEGADAEENIVVETEAVRAVFSNRGAVLTSWQLKQHTEQESDEWVELIPRDLPPHVALPFTLAFDDPALSARARDALFRTSRATRADAVTQNDRAEAVSFVFEDSSGFRIRKQFAFDPVAHDYLFHVSVEATFGDQVLFPALQWGPALGGVESASSGIAYRAGPRGVLYGRVQEGGELSDMDIERLDAGDVVARPVYSGQLRFAGVDNHYFLAAALTDNPAMEVGYRAVPLPPLQPEGTPRDLMAFELRWPDGVMSEVPFFLGPKNFESLEQVSPALIQAIDFGWFGWIVVPLHRSLSWIYDSSGNWGWAIIILTFLITVITFPLNHTSIVAMRKMQEVGPEIKAIQERYAHLKTTDPDKAKMNQEVMALYRDRGVNPAMGCLPMLLTMPVLFAFYSLLSVAVEIRGEPFIGWITDLTLKDPFFITPLLMGVSMVVQQKMTPTQADPMQQKMMMLMPVIFTGMFLWAPSGLVLYWLTSNVLRIVQTKFTYRVIGSPKVHHPRPAAERRIKQRAKVAAQTNPKKK